MIWTIAFWKGAAERAFHTFWQTFSAILFLAVGGELVPALGVEGINWTAALSGAAVAAILSLAKSLGDPAFTAGKVVTVEAAEPSPVTVEQNISLPNAEAAADVAEVLDNMPRRGGPLGFHR